MNETGARDAAHAGDVPARLPWGRNAINNGRVFGLTYALVSRLPPRMSYAIGWACTWIAYRTMRRVTRALADNLRAIRPDATPRQLAALALETYRSYARDVTDFIRSLSMDERQLDRLFVFEGRELFESLRATGSGALMVTGHFGNWEIGGVMMRHYGIDLDVVVRAEPDPAVNALRRRFRDSIGVRTIEAGQSLDTALQIRRRLAANGCVAMLMDRHVEKDRVPVRFLDRSASFLRTPALMAYLAGAPLVPCFIERQPDGRYRAKPDPPIYVDRTLDRERAIQHAAQAFATVLERHVRARPDLWYQFYPYWDVQEDR